MEQTSQLRRRGGDPVTPLGRSADGEYQSTDALELYDGLVGQERVLALAIPDMVRIYLNQCRLYGVEGDPGVLLTIRFQLPDLRVSADFCEKQMLPLADIMLAFGGGRLSHVRKLDFTLAGKAGSGLRSGGAVALSKVLAQTGLEIIDLKLEGNRIGPYGANALAQGMAESKVRSLSLRLNFIGEAGAKAIAQYLLRNHKCCIECIDLTLNNTGFVGVQHIQHAMDYRAAAGLPPVTVDMDGNLFFAEIMNSITHGLGVVFCTVATILLSLALQGKSTRHIGACAFYLTSLCVLFTSSTLYHSFFALKTTRAIFKVFDWCAIYLLITGSYTPFMIIMFPDKPLWSRWLLSFLYLCGFVGILTELPFKSPILSANKTPLSLALYIGMGWAVLLCLPDIVTRLPTTALALLVAGGLAYTGGVPFFVRNRNLDHAVWHVFVLAGAIFHWLCVYLYVVDLP